VIRIQRTGVTMLPVYITPDHIHERRVSRWRGIIIQKRLHVHAKEHKRMPRKKAKASIIKDAVVTKRLADLRMRHVK
jgi:hypothetical protein